jgi:carbonic anhydrase
MRLNRSILATSLLVASVLTTSAVRAEGAHWGYDGDNGPQHWGELDSAYGVCSTGKNQSPVDISGTIEGDLPEIAFSYSSNASNVVNNGHTVQVNYAPGSTISVNGQQFELKQFHFHAPSENTLNGEHFPMEAHFVHADARGNLAVVAVMFREGAANPELEKAWSVMPEKAGESKPLTSTVNAASLLPASHDYYRFNGSLTTPPCSEGVVWLVMKDADTASKEQIERFTHAVHHDNNRPVQPLNARVIVQ